MGPLNLMAEEVVDFFQDGAHFFEERAADLDVPGFIGLFFEELKPGR